MDKKNIETFADDVNTTGDDDTLSRKNLVTFSMGSFGRELVQGFFIFQLLNYIIFTKQISEKEFAFISFIIIIARVFDAFNDPIMGTIIDRTHTKWGKFRPWQLIGAVSTAAVIITMFSNTLHGRDFVILASIMYFLFSITFTMNDISYWAMMPTLTNNQTERSKLMSGAQIVGGIGASLAGIVPLVTIGALAIGGAVAGFRNFSIVAAILLIGFQLVTILGVKEKDLSEQIKDTEKFSFQQIIKKIVQNDQLLWVTLATIIFIIAPTVIVAGLGTVYVYFEFGYSGLYFSLFMSLYGGVFMLYPFIYPYLEKKFTRTKMVYITGFAMVIGFALMLIFGLAFPTSPEFSTLWFIKFISMTLAFGIAGFGQGYIMLMVLALANTVEYNEYKTGKREEGLIFSARSFSMKLSGGLVQGLITVVYLIAGVLKYSNQISALENEAAIGIITEEAKLQQIGVVIDSVPTISRTILLLSLCLIPIICISTSMFIYKKKYILDEKTFTKIVKEIEERKLKESE